MALGATGTFTHGKVAPDDEGDLMLAVGCDHENQVVKVVFGKPVSWIGLDREKAVAFANSILRKAEELDH